MTSTTITGAALAVKTGKREEPEWIVFVVVAVALMLGWFLKMSVENSTATFSGAGISINYPATWLREPGAGAADLLFKVSDLRSGSLYPTNLTLQMTEPAQAPVGDEDKLTPSVTSWGFGRSQTLDNYRVLSTKSVTLAGQPAAQIDYTYVSNPIASPYRQALPVVVEATDYLTLFQDKLYIITIAADATRFEQNKDRFETVLQSIAFANK